MTNGNNDRANDGNFLEVEVAPEASPAEATDDLSGLPVAEQLATLRSNLAEMRQETAQSKELAQRAQADLVNYRKRAEEERLTLRQEANRRLIINLLPVIDELELAINHIGSSDGNGDGDPADSWVEGVKLIYRKAYGILESEGLSKIEAAGALFDPLQHEAIGVVESAEYPSGYVVEAIRNGYRLRDRVIQAAQVVVAR